jgi:hypothetical protein
VKVKLYFGILCRNCIPVSNMIEDYFCEEVKVEESTLPNGLNVELCMKYKQLVPIALKLFEK